MNFQLFQTELRPLLVFTTGDIRKVDPAFSEVNLSNWRNKGYIKKLAKGCYTFGDITIDRPLLFYAANKLTDPSYVSCESALSFFGLLKIEDALTSVSSVKSNDFKSDYGGFKFHYGKPKMMNGFVLVETHGHRARVARPEKAMADFLYFNAKYQTREAIRTLPFEESAFDDFDFHLFKHYSYEISNEQYSLRIRNFINIYEA